MHSASALRCAGAACLSLYDETTHELICESCPTLGVTANPGGAPVSYMQAMSQTNFVSPMSLSTRAPLLMLSKYNSTESHTGKGT